MSQDFADVLAALQAEGTRIAARYPGENGSRQPVHTVYGGAHLFRADTVLAKHDENYMPREVVDALKKQGVWKHEEKK